MAQRGCHWHVPASQKPCTSSLEVRGILDTTTSPALHTGHPAEDDGLPASKAAQLWLGWTILTSDILGERLRQHSLFL